RHIRGIHPVEWPHHRRFNVALVRGMIEGDHEDRDAERIRKENVFLTLVTAGLAHLGEELDGCQPLGFSQPYLAYEIVQMSDQGGHDLPEAWVPAFRHPLNHCGGNAFLIKLTHRALTDRC